MDESITSVVDVFVGVLRSEMLAIGDHPVVGVLNAAARRLMVLDAQLPVPVPVGGYGDRQWARVRVGLRNTGDIERLAEFLDHVYKGTAAGSNTGQQYVVAVKAARTSAPRVITESKKCCTAESSLVLTSDLDITYPAANNNEATDTPKWRVLTFCSDARSNIESDIVNKLADATGRQLQLVGLTYALLHGMAIMTIVAYSRGECTERLKDLAAKLNQDPARKFQLLINEKLNRSELVPFTEYPLLRVHFRWHDRPGAILNVLDSLSKTLADEFPSINELEWSVSYARARAPADGAAVARLTLRIHTTPDVLESWKPDNEEIERKVRTRAALEAIAGRSTSSAGDKPDILEDPVISVNLIRTPIPGDDLE